MLIRTGTERLSSRESGGALVAALTVVATVGMLSAMTFQLNQSTWQRQLTENNRKRAFYLAEAGISESMAAITMGLGGNVGSKEEPAQFGEGFVFSEVLEDQWGVLQIDSYGICGDARHHLSLAVEKLHVPLAQEGFFGEQFVEIGANTTVTTAPDPGSGGGTGDLPTASGAKPEQVATGGGLLLGGGLVGGLTGGVGIGGASAATLETVVASPSILEAELHKAEKEAWKVSWLGGGDFQLNTWDLPEITGEKYATGMPFDAGDFRPLAPEDSTAKVGSNGAITIDPGIGGNTLLDASVHPGPGHTVTPGVGVVITGSTTPQTETEVLPTLPVPTLDASGDLLVAARAFQTETEPYASYGAVAVPGTSTLTLVGPGQVVCDSLRLDPGAVLVIDSSSGPVEFHVQDTISIGAGAEIQSPTADATGFLLYAHGTDSVVGVTEKVILSGSGTFHGLLYAPFAHLELPATTSFVGSVIARSLTVQPNTSLTYAPALLNESYSALVVQPIAWIIDEVPADLRASVYDPEGDYRAAGITPPLLSESWQETELVVRYQDDTGAEYTYRGNTRTNAELGATIVIDSIDDTDALFEVASVPPGGIFVMQTP